MTTTRTASSMLYLPSDHPSLPAHETVMICGYHVPAEGFVRDVHAAEISLPLEGGDGLAWLHFRLSNTRTKRLLLELAHYSEECQHDFLIAYSCKCRGICPSCNTRRMSETASHLVDHVFSPLLVRQWVR